MDGKANWIPGRIATICIAVLFAAPSGWAALHHGAVQVSGAPVVGAVVTASGESQKLATVTDMHGLYQLVLPAGAWVLEVKAPGLATATKQLQVSETPSDLKWDLKVSMPKPAAPKQVESVGPAMAPGEGYAEQLIVNGSIAAPSTGPAAPAVTLKSAIAETHLTESGALSSSDMVTPGEAALQRAVKQRLTAKKATVFGNKAPQSGGHLHGSVQWTENNSAFDARPYSLTGNPGPAPSYASNRYSASLGGPLPVLQPDKTFFYFGYSGSSTSRLLRRFATVPTETERSGDFSTGLLSHNIIADPLTGAPFPGNIIPATRIAPQAGALLSYIPLPNESSSLLNYQSALLVPAYGDLFSTTITRVLNRANQFTFKVQGQFNGSSPAQIYGFSDAVSGSGFNSGFVWNHSVRKTTVQLRVGFNRLVSGTTPFFASGPDEARLLGIAGTSSDPDNFGPPDLHFTNFTGLSDSGSAWQANENYFAGGQINVVRKAHSLTAGVEIRRVLFDTTNNQSGRGALDFTGAATSLYTSAGLPLPNSGADLADFLLGLPQQGSIRYSPGKLYFRSLNAAGYVQDDWHLRRNLTFAFGLRYEYAAPFVEKYDRLANLDFSSTLGQVAVVVPGQSGPYSGTFGQALVRSDRLGLAPRAALAWRPRRHWSTVVRAGYTLFGDPSPYTAVAQALSAQPPFAVASTIQATSGAPLTFANAFLPLPSKTVDNTFAIAPDFRIPRAQTWEVSIKQPLHQGLDVELTYRGILGSDLGVLTIPNRARPGASLTSEDRLPIPNAIPFVYAQSDGHSIFHSAQIVVSRHTKGGLFSTVMYTFGKSLDNASGLGGLGKLVAQSNDLRQEWGLSAFDQRHVVSIVFGAQSPAGRWRKTPVVTPLFKNWSLTGSILGGSGLPFTARVLGNLADAAGTGAFGAERADATGVSISGGPIFNTAAFAVPVSGQLGNAGRNTIPGPWQVNVSGSLLRSFAITERHPIELRLDAINAINRVSIASFGTVVNSTTYGLPLAAAAMRSISATVRFRF